VISQKMSIPDLLQVLRQCSNRLTPSYDLPTKEGAFSSRRATSARPLRKSISARAHALTNPSAPAKLLDDNTVYLDSHGNQSLTGFIAPRLLETSAESDQYQLKLSIQKKVEQQHWVPSTFNSSCKLKERRSHSSRLFEPVRLPKQDNERKVTERMMTGSRKKVDEDGLATSYYDITSLKSSFNDRAWDSKLDD